jgi:hypothetical protein
VNAGLSAANFSPHQPDHLWISDNLLHNGYGRALSQGTKQPGREVDHSPPSSEGAEISRAIPPFPIRSHGVLLKDRDKFTLNLLRGSISG